MLLLYEILRGTNCFSWLHSMGSLHFFDTSVQIY